MTPLIRGTTLVIAKQYLAARGPDAWPDVVAAMPAKWAAEVPRLVIPTEWYPEPMMVAFTDAAARLFGDGYYEDIGRYTAEYDLTVVHRFLLRFTSPAWIFDRGARMWREYHDTGRWEVVRGKDGRSVTGTLIDHGVVSLGQCRVTLAFLKRICEMTGAKDLRGEHPRCRARGASSCVFAGSWR